MRSQLLPFHSLCQKTLTSVAALIVSVSAQAKIESASIVQKQIEAKQAGWVAKDNWVNQLDENRVKMLLGAPSPKGDVSFQNNERMSRVSGNSIDWRSNNGSNWVSPILNQGACGSCVAFAAVATLETQMNISSGMPWLNPRFSTEALFSCGGGGCHFGWTPGAAAQYLTDNGVPDEACAPYTMGATSNDVACSTVCTDAANRSVKLANFTTPSQGAATESVKQALAKGPMMTTLTVYSDFIVYGSGVYKHTTGKRLGGHAVSLIGFDDDKRAWIIRNSWGTGWGMNGFAYVSYDDVSGIADQTWQFEPAMPSGYVTLKNLRDRAFLAGQLNLRAFTNVGGAQGMTTAILDADKKEVARMNCAGQECDMAFDTSKLPDGRYEAQISTQGRNTVLSQTRYFFIANQKPVLSLNFDLPGAGQVKDRVEFKVNWSSSTVPLSAIDFVVVQNGVEVLRRSSDNIAQDLKVGWRSNLVANGTYDIFFVGHVATNVGDTIIETAHKTVQVQN